MSYKDVITNPQKVIQVFADEQVKEVLADKNHRKVLQFLFKSPLTVDELAIAFKSSGEKKDVKSIYRYLKNLKDADLVIESGKRFTDSAPIKTKTLFSRAAKIIFTPSSRFEGVDDIEKKSYEILTTILRDKLGLKNAASLDCLKSNTQNLIKEKNKAIASYFENNSNPELIELIEDFEIHELYPILDLAGWVILFEESPEILNDMIKCFK
jgi:hypothetical protein